MQFIYYSNISLNELNNSHLYHVTKKMIIKYINDKKINTSTILENYVTLFYLSPNEVRDSVIFWYPVTTELFDWSLYECIDSYV